MIKTCLSTVNKWNKWFEVECDYVDNQTWHINQSKPIVLQWHYLTRFCLDITFYCKENSLTNAWNVRFYKSVFCEFIKTSLCQIINLTVLPIRNYFNGETLFEDELLYFLGAVTAIFDLYHLSVHCTLISAKVQSECRKFIQNVAVALVYDLSIYILLSMISSAFLLTQSALHQGWRELEWDLVPTLTLSNFEKFQ